MYKKKSHREYCFYLILCTLALFNLSSCKYGLHSAFYRSNEVQKRSTHLTDITLPEQSTWNNKESITFMIASDLHFGSNKSTGVPQEAFLRSIASEQADFIVYNGDLTDSGTANEYKQLQDFTHTVQNTFSRNIPCFAILGNHDLYNDGWNVFSKTTYPYVSFFRIKIDGISWYFLDTASGTLGNPQLETLKKEMTGDSNSKIVFSHYPLYGNNQILYFLLTNTRERTVLLDLYARHNVIFSFAGHYHNGGFFSFGSFREIIVGKFFQEQRQGSQKEATWLAVTINKEIRSVKVKRFFSSGRIEENTYPF